MTENGAVYLVDDDPSVTRALSCLLDSVQLKSHSFHSGAAFLKELDSLPALACTVLDLRMPSMSGLEVLRSMRHRKNLLPVIILSSHGDIPTTVEVMRLGAIDFLQKPFNAEYFLETIYKALRSAAHNEQAQKKQQSIDNRLRRLSVREQDVFKAMLRGDSSKLIARNLNISYKTVNAHRTSIMRKLNVSSYHDLLHAYGSYLSPTTQYDSQAPFNAASS